MRKIEKRQTNGSYPFRTAEGVTIEQQLREFMNGSGDVNFVRTPYYPDKSIGVAPETNIRTDMHEIQRETIEVANNAYLQAHQIRLENKFGNVDQVKPSEIKETPPPSTQSNSEE